MESRLRDALAALQTTTDPQAGTTPAQPRPRHGARPRRTGTWTCPARGRGAGGGGAAAGSFVCESGNIDHCA